MFDHMHFLSSFRILEIIRLTVARMRSSFNLLVRGFLFRPHKRLESGSCWSFFIGYSPVQQSLQEYLGVLVVFRSALKGNLSWLSWGSDFWTYWTRHREQHVHLESSDLRDICNQRNISEYEYHFNTQDVGWVIRYPFHSLHSGYEIRVSSSST